MNRGVAALKAIGAAADRASVAWPAAAAIGLALAASPPAARADLWSVESNIGTRLEANDNQSLSPDPSGTVTSLSVTTGVKASRQSESWSSVLNGLLTGVKQAGSGAQDRVDGSLAFTQSLSGELDTYTLGLTFSQDFNNLVSNADVALGQGQRRTRLVSAGWTHALSERLSTSVQVSLDNTRFGQPLTLAGASDYRNVSVSGGLSYRLNETDTLSVSAQYADFRTVDASRTSTTESVDVGWSRALSEDTSVSLSLGTYRTRSTSLVLGVICPLPVIFCQVGLVPFVLVTEPSRTSGQGLQYSGSYNLRLDELSGVAVSAGRQQAPSGAGTVVTSDTLSASASRSFSETVSASAAYAWSRSRFTSGTGVEAPTQQSLTLSLSRQLAPDLSLGAGYQRTQSDLSGSGRSAHANILSVSLNYAWPPLQVTR